jgi:hypothetical protein
MKKCESATPLQSLFCSLSSYLSTVRQTFKPSTKKRYLFITKVTEDQCMTLLLVLAKRDARKNRLSLPTTIQCETVNPISTEYIYHAEVLMSAALL